MRCPLRGRIGIQPPTAVLITLVAPPGPGYERAMNVSRAANAVGAPVWSLVQEGDALLSGLSTEQFILPPVPEFWSPPGFRQRIAPYGGALPYSPLRGLLSRTTPARPPPAATMNCKGAENVRR